MQKITPFLWYDTQAEEAMNLYVSIFKDSKVLSVHRAGGRVITVTFELAGQPIMALNAGPKFKFTEAFSLFVNCETQEEIDTYWDKLIANGGAPSMCGWLKDRFGLSWQIIPTGLGQWLGDPDPARSKRVMDALFTMQKIDIAALKRAHDGQ